MAGGKYSPHTHTDTLPSSYPIPPMHNASLSSHRQHHTTTTTTINQTTTTTMTLIHRVNTVAAVAVVFFFFSSHVPSSHTKKTRKHTEHMKLCTSLVVHCCRIKDGARSIRELARFRRVHVAFMVYVYYERLSGHITYIYMYILTTHTQTQPKLGARARERSTLSPFCSGMRARACG